MKRSLLIIGTLLTVSLGYAAKLNQSAPDFKLLNADGQSRSLADYKGKVLFINFWASWCAPCQVELPQLDQLDKEYAQKNFSLIGINVDTDRAAADKTLDKLRIGISRMEILFDPESKAVQAFNPDGMPSSFIVDPAGVIRVIHVGFHKQDPEKWRQEIDRLLKAA